MKKILVTVLVGILLTVLAGCFVIKQADTTNDSLSGDDVLLIAKAIFDQVNSTQKLPEECLRTWQVKGESVDRIKLADASYLMAKFLVEFCGSSQKPTGIKYLPVELPNGFETGDLGLLDLDATCTTAEFCSAVSNFVSDIEKTKVLPSSVSININNLQREISLDVFIPTLAKILNDINGTGTMANEVTFCSALLPFSWPAKIKAVWVWGTTLANSGVEQTLQRIKELGVTDVLLLVKGTSGTVNWPSKVALGFASDTTVLPKAAQYCKTNGLRLHVWFVCNQDEKFANTYPEYKMYGIPKVQGGELQRAGKSIDFVGSQTYREYLKSLIAEVIENYDPDGLHFDYIRYPTGAWGWGPAELDRARENGLSESDIEYLEQLAIQTWGTGGDNQSFINAYLSDDATVTKWVELRSANVLDFLNELSEYAKHIKPDLIVSAALMPEPGSSDPTERAFGLVHYGQNYESFEYTCEMIIPMAYHRDYGKDITWITDTILSGTKEQVQQNKVVVGLQGYSPVTGDELSQAVKNCLDKNADGVCVFRAGTVLDTERETPLKEILRQYK
ncbi:MAG TPA: family 10 glycosylhydrolase [Pseudothermotoga sp.]|nr:family 10 glycosylhydrolase [Pseudothermotoga sp.]